MSGTAGVPELTLHAWTGMWGLSSVDPFCASVETYLRFAALPFALNASNNPSASPNGVLPFLTDGEDVVHDSLHIIDRLRTYSDLDAPLTDQQRAESFAFVAMVQARLNTALMYHWWCQEDNATKVTLRSYGMLSSFPLSMILPRMMRRHWTKQLSLSHDSDGDAIYGEADDCLLALSRRLGKKRYFFGDAPTSLDAVAYAFLAAMLIPAEFPDQTLRQLVRAYPNLERFVSNIRTGYFDHLGAAPVSPGSEGVAAPGPFSPGSAGSFTAHADRTTSRPRPAKRQQDPSSWWWARAARRVAGDGSGGKNKRHKSEEEIALQRRARWAIAGAIGALGLYIAFGSFPLVRFEYLDDDDDDDDDYE